MLFLSLFYNSFPFLQLLVSLISRFLSLYPYETVSFPSYTLVYSGLFPLLFQFLPFTFPFISFESSIYWLVMIPFHFSFSFNDYYRHLHCTGVRDFQRRFNGVFSVYFLFWMIIFTTSCSFLSSFLSRNVLLDYTNWTWPQTFWKILEFLNAMSRKPPTQKPLCYGPHFWKEFQDMTSQEI